MLRRSLIFLVLLSADVCRLIPTTARLNPQSRRPCREHGPGKGNQP